MANLKLGQTVIIMKGEHAGVTAKITGFACGGYKLVNANTLRKLWNGNMSSFDASWVNRV